MSRHQAWRKHVYKSDGFETEFSGEVVLAPVADQ